MKHFLFISLGTLLVAASLGLFSGVQAVHAASATLTCLGTENQQLNPAITNTPQTVQVTINDLFAPCPLTPDPQLTGGTSHDQITVPNVSCTAVLGGTPRQETYDWNNGTQSVVNFTTVKVNRLVNGSTMIILIGRVASGLDSGFAVTKTVTDPDISIVCDTTGLSTLSGIVTIEFSLI